MKHGLFITLEGLEGVGKTTQAALLVERLRQAGHTVQAVREPGGTPLGESIRHLLKDPQAGRDMTPETELLLVNASRAQLVAQVIRPALDRGELVVADRFYDSTVAYQGFGRGLALESVRAVIDLAVGDVRPDLTLYLTLPLQVGAGRMRKREEETGEGPDRFERGGREFFRRVEAGFLAVAEAEPDRVREIVVKGGEADVAAEVWTGVESLLQERQQGQIGG